MCARFMTDNMMQGRHNAKMTQCKDTIVQDGLGLNSCVASSASKQQDWTEQPLFLSVQYNRQTASS